MKKIGMLLGAALVILPISAEAAVTVTDYEFTSSFERGIYPTLSGTFSISHDSESGAYALTALNYSVEGFTHNLSNSSMWYYFEDNYDDDDYDRITIYGNANGRNVNEHTVDFDFTFGVGRGSEYISTVYSTLNAYVIPAGHTRLDVVSAPPVPEPASWAMMIAGLGLVGGVLRQHRTNRRFAF